MKTLLSLITFFALSTTVMASNYPPDYPLSSDCQEQDQVRVCRNIGWNWISMSVTYKGNLLNTTGADDNLKVWIKLNGNEGTFPMRVERWGLGQLARKTISTSTHDCRYVQGSGSSWTCDRSTDEMRHVLYWAKGAYTGTVRSNAWQVNIAFVNESTGQWDNNNQEYGSYYFEFWQK